ncbi:hypothetical protein L1887_48559 [Cichorium endivia]|nr:hypothetical protein L1887_48559 [Cichorium endivia]
MRAQRRGRRGSGIGWVRRWCRLGKKGTEEVEGGVAFDMQSRRALEAGRERGQWTIADAGAVAVADSGRQGGAGARTGRWVMLCVAIVGREGAPMHEAGGPRQGGRKNWKAKPGSSRATAKAGHSETCVASAMSPPSRHWLALGALFDMDRRNSWRSARAESSAQEKSRGQGSSDEAYSMSGGIARRERTRSRQSETASKRW